MKFLWKLRFLGRSRPIRKAVSMAFRAIFRHGSTVRIPFGPLRGMRWYVHRDHQFWMPLGTYETETSGWLLDTLNPGDTFFDVGGNAGYFTLLGSIAVGENGHVHVFEPVPINAEVIERQIAANDLRNVTLHRTALCDRNGPVSFTVQTSNANSHLAEIDVEHFKDQPVSRIEVQGRTLDDVADDIGLPDLIKVDVEGAEVLVIRGASNSLRKRHPRLIVSTHTDALRAECRVLLSELDYPDVDGLPGFEHELIG